MIKKDSYARFMGYTEENTDPLLTKGQIVKIINVKVGEGEVMEYHARPVKEDGTFIGDSAEQLFDGELEEVADAKGTALQPVATEAAPAAEAEAQVAEAKPAKGKAKAEKPAKTKAKAEKPAKGKAAAQAIVDEATKAEKPAKGKKSAKTEAKAEAKAEEKAAEKREAETATASQDEMMREVTPMESVSVILKDHTTLDAATELVRRAEQTDFTLGGVLQIIYMRGDHRALGPTFDGKIGFDKYVEEHLGLEKRKARYLMNIYVKFAVVFSALQLNSGETTLAELGWSVVKELARIPEEDLIRDFHKIMADVTATGEDGKKLLNREGVQSYIKENYDVVTRGEQVKKVSFKFTLLAEEGEVAQRALEQAKTIIGENDDSKAFNYICGDFLNEAPTSDLSFEQWKAIGAARFGINTDEITMGDSDEATAGSLGGEAVSPATA